MLEVERKFHLSSEKFSELKIKLQELSGPPTKLHQIDKIFLSRSESFKDFKRGEPVMRLRSVGGSTLLTYKRALTTNGVVDIVEHELLIDSSLVAEALLREIGYHPVVQVEKDRWEYNLAPLTICLDEVRGLGLFLEIEIMCGAEGELSVAQDKIMTMAKELGLDRSALEEKKYDQLMSEKM